MDRLILPIDHRTFNSENSVIKMPFYPRPENGFTKEEGIGENNEVNEENKRPLA